MVRWEKKMKQLWTPVSRSFQELPDVKTTLIIRMNARRTLTVNAYSNLTPCQALFCALPIHAPVEPSQQPDGEGITPIVQMRKLRQRQMKQFAPQIEQPSG